VSPGAGNDAFITKYDADGDLVYSSLFGGSSTDYLRGLAVDASGQAWFVVESYSSDFPVCPSACAASAPPAYQPSTGGGYDFVVGRLGGTGSALTGATYLGGTSSDYAKDIEVTSTGKIVVSGYTYSTNFPTVDPVFPTLTPYCIGSFCYTFYTDTVVARFDPATVEPEFSTYLGGAFYDYGYGIAGDDQDNIYAAGDVTSATSSGFPMVKPHMGTAASTQDGYVSIFGKGAPVPVVRANTTGYTNTTSPMGTPHQVLTYEVIHMDGNLTKAGDAPLDPTTAYWELLDPIGSVVATDTATLLPSFTPKVRPDDELWEACLTISDTSSTSYDNTATACLDLEWMNRPPIAAIAMPSTLPEGVPIAFLEASTDDRAGLPDGTVDAWAWDFGDATTANVQNPVHTYAVGTYDLVLEVTDDDGATNKTNLTVVVEKGPVAAFTSPATLLSGIEATFTDASLAGARAIEEWVWDFGDGTVVTKSAGGSVGHTYEAGGTYNVCLTVKDGLFEKKTCQAVVVAWTLPEPEDDVFVTYTGLTLAEAAPGLLGNDDHPLGSSLSVASVDTTTVPPTHAIIVDADGSFTYTPPAGFLGTVAFEYDVTDGDKTVSGVEVAIEVVEFPPPTAIIGGRVSGDFGFFEDDSVPGHPSHPLVAWHWDFGDGVTSTLPDPVHPYPGPGTYDVMLTVTDSYGFDDTTYWKVFVSATPGQPETFSDAPVAVAGEDRTVTEGASVVLDGTRSIGAGLRHTWQQTGGPAVELAGHDRPHPVFVAPAVTGAGPAGLTFALRVYDGYRWSAADEVRVTVEAAEHRPTATVALPVQHVRPGETVVLEGRGIDPDGDAVIHRWKQIDGPTVPLPGTAEPMVRFTAPSEGTLRFKYTVSDGTSKATAETVVEVVPSGPLAAFTATPGDEPGLWTFEATTEGVQYEWDFGDGSPPSHLAAPTHPYAQSGDHTVSLVVTDAEGRTDLVAREIHVEATTSADGAGTALDAGAAEAASTRLGEDAGDRQDAGTDAAAVAHDVPTALSLVVTALAAALLVRRRRGRSG